MTTFFLPLKSESFTSFWFWSFNVKSGAAVPTEIAMLESSQFAPATFFGLLVACDRAFIIVEAARPDNGLSVPRVGWTRWEACSQKKGLALQRGLPETSRRPC